MSTADWVRHASIWAAFLGQLVYVVGYASTRWWVHWLTRSMMLKSGVLLLLLGLTCWRYGVRYLSDVPVLSTETWSVQGAAESVLYIALSVAVWGQAVALIREVRRGGRRIQ